MAAWDGFLPETSAVRQRTAPAGPPVSDRIEKVTFSDCHEGNQERNIYLASIAISLKRIADSLERK